MLVVFAVLSGLPCRAAEPQPILGGEPALAADWPEVVALFSNRSLVCTGTLVAPDLVLTAAHCNYGLTHVRLGASDLSEPATEVLEVARTWSHPDNWRTYDVAVVELETPSQASPAVLATDCAARRIASDGALLIAGYGAVDADAEDFPGVLQIAQVPVHDPVCAQVERGCNEEVSPGGELLAGGDGTDTCVGDSGGPAFLDTEAGRFLAGVTSRASSPSTSMCGDGGIYVRADAVIDWVEQVSGRSLARPDCDTLDEPPVLASAVLSLEGMAGAMQLEASDPDSTELSWDIIAAPQHGTATLDQGRLVYIARTPWSRPDDLVEVRVTDDTGLSATATVFVEPVPSHSPPRGCHTAPSGALPLVLLLLLRRRKTRGWTSAPTPGSPGTPAAKRPGRSRRDGC